MRAWSGCPVSPSKEAIAAYAYDLWVAGGFYNRTGGRDNDDFYDDPGGSLVIGSWSEDQQAFVPALTVRADGLVTRHGRVLARDRTTRRWTRQLPAIAVVRATPESIFWAPRTSSRVKAPLAPMQCHAGRSPFGRTGSTDADVVSQIANDHGLTPDVDLDLNGFTLALVMASFGWPFDARLIRSVALGLKHREFTRHAVFAGMSTPKILLEEHLPYVMPIVFGFAPLAFFGGDGAEVGLAQREPEPPAGQAEPTGMPFDANLSIVADADPEPAPARPQGLAGKERIVAGWVWARPR